MNTYAYDAGLPCKNPNCKSHGRPHPNCKCYGLAEGGEVGFYCDSNQPHQQGCEYYSDGGDIKPPAYEDTIPSEQEPPKYEDTQPYSEPAAAGPAYEKTLPLEEKSDVGEGARAMIEGAARGITGGLSDAIYQPLRDLGESMGINPDWMAPNPKEVSERKDLYPAISQGSEAASQVLGLVTGSGAPGLISKAAGAMAPEAVTVLGKLGSAALKGFIETGLIQGGDEISNHLLGRGDPEASVASSLVNMGAAGLLGAGVGTITGGASQGLKALGDMKAGKKISSFLAGMGGQRIPEEAKAVLGGKWWNELGKSEQIDRAAFNAGQGFAEKLPDLVRDAVTKKASAVAGATIGNFPGYVLADKVIGPFLDKAIGEPISNAAKKYSVPIALKLMSSGETTGLFDLINQGAMMNQGLQSINRGIDAIFKVGGKSFLDDMISDHRARDRVNKYVESGHLNDEIQDAASAVPAFAKGGIVEPVGATSPMAQHYPTQDMMIQTAKARVNGYLNSVRPQAVSAKRPFDTSEKDPQKERDYHEVIDLANQPLRVLKHIKDGTLNSTQMKHFISLYPEVHSFLSKKIMERVSQAQIAKEKPPYKVRQALGLFLGQPLDSSMTPQSIMAAQNVFVQKRQNQAQMGNPVNVKRGTSTLSKASNNLRTPDQSSEVRQQRIQ